MELNELKANWNLLNEQLKKNEILNTKVARQLIEKRTLSARDRLVRANILAILVMLFVLTVIPLATAHVTIRPEVQWIAYTVLPVTILYTLWNIRFLLKFDMQRCTLVQLRRWVIAYKRRMRLECYCTPFITIGLFLSVFMLHHHYHSMLFIVFDSFMLLVTAVVSYLGYVYGDKRSLYEIESGLKELEDFESVG